jgi:acetylornithine deacetylase/succinyl-diaminopimelate desuccinylase-like protein
MGAPTSEVVELLQQLIRNRCVNDGTPESGHEERNADVLAAYLEGSGVAVQRYEPLPGRTSLVARIEGRETGAPSLCLMGHTDVVPANEERWHRDPFGGELVDGVVWGRGAVDMLDTTASMAVAFKRLVDDGFRPRGDVVYFAVADEEAAGFHGAKWMIDHEPDAVRADYVVTEFGGMRFPGVDGVAPHIPIMVAEKGTFWVTITVRGTPGHASMPFQADNALVKAARIVERLAAFEPPAKLGDVWRRFVGSMDFAPEVARALQDPARVEELVEQMPLPLARMLHACTHTTIAPTVMRAGVKSNVIPDTVDLKVDIRTLPGETADDVREMLREALGDLAEDIAVMQPDSDMPASESPVDTPLWDALSGVIATLVPGARSVPFLIVGATDARYLRTLGAVAYGAGLLSDRIPIDEFGRMFHGDDERVDVESLRLLTELWEQTSRRLLS